MSLSHESAVFMDLSADFEFLICGAVEGQVQVEEIYIIPGASAGLQAVNFTTLSILDKGVGGAGSDVIAILTTDSGGGGIALTARVKQQIALSATGPYLLTGALTIEKEDNGTPVDLQECLIICKVRQIGG